MDNIQVPQVNVAALMEDVNREATLMGTPEAFLPGNVVPTGRIWKEPTTTPIGVAEVITSTSTPTPVPTLQVTNTPTAIISPTTAPSKTQTRQPTFTYTPSPTPTRTYVWVPPTLTPTESEPEPPVQPPTKTPTVTLTHTVTPTRTITRTPTQTHTVTLTATITNTPTKTATITLTPTATKTFTPSPTFTVTSTPTPTATTAPVRPVAENDGASEPYDGKNCLAYFGYKNDNAVAVTIPVETQDGASQNKVQGTGNVQIFNQTTVFEPGRHSGTFYVIWDSGDTITWWLLGKPVTANWCSITPP